MKKTKGFTLIEMVAVIAIMIVLCGLAVPAVSQFIITSRMIQYNDYAKTILLSAQSYLTYVRTAGQLSVVLAEKGADVPKEQVGADYYAEETSYLMLSKENGPDDDYLITILQDYVVDPGVLDQTICVEYNARTGMVHSVCYSEIAPAFTYGATYDGAVSIANRSEDARKAGQFGYYSVDLLEPPTSAIPLEESEIFLKDENNQLFCEWTDASPRGSVSFGGSITYDLSIRDADSGTLLMSMKILDDGKNVPTYSSVGSFEAYKRDLSVINYVDGVPSAPVMTKCWLYKITGVPQRFHLALDMIDTSGNVEVTPVRSITTAFPGIGSRNIVAAISASGDSYAKNKGTVSNKKHSLFGETNGKAAKIESERHLYNIRYGAVDMQYSQNKDLDWKSAFNSNQVIFQDGIAEKFPDRIASDVSGARYAFPPAVYTGEARLSELAFTGSYNGSNYTVSNLYLSGRMGIDGSYATRSGLFSINGGVIENLKLEDATLRAGVSTSGAIAGANLVEGSIKNVTVTANQMESTASHFGGIVGLNEGTLENCALTTNTLSGKESLGGISGKNTGNILNTTASVKGNLKGENLVGGISGENTGSIMKATALVAGDIGGGDLVGGMVGDNSGTIAQSAITITGNIAGKKWVGGITGSNSSDTSEISGTTAAAAFVKGTTEVGGMAGFNRGIIKTGSISILGVNAGEKLGGIAGVNEGTLTNNGAKSTFSMTITATSGDYVGGAVGLNQKTGNNPGVVTSCDLPVSIQSGQSDYVGGVVGKNEGGIVTSAGGQKVTLAGNQQVGGLIGENTGTLELKKGNLVTITGKDNTGGVVGLNKGRISGVMTTETGSTIIGNNCVGGIIGQNVNSNPVTYTNISNKASVMGNSNVGGVIGWNNSVILTNCSNTGAIVGEGSNVGGIVGNNTVSSGEYQLLVNSGSIQGGSYVGGIMGTNLNNTLRACTNTGNIFTSKEYGGGIVGQNGSSTETNAKIINCKSNMETKTESQLLAKAKGDYIGGIAGYNNGTITNDTNTNMVANIGGANFVGGIVGHNDSRGTIRFCSISGGNVVATGDFVGGYIGLNTSRAASKMEDNAGSQGNAMELNSNPNLVTGKRYVGGAIGANLVASDGASGATAVSLSVSSKARTDGRIVATAFAGGTLGYNGVIASADEAALKSALAVLRDENYNPLSEEDGGKDVPVTKLVRCENYLSVTADRFVGGIIGYNSTKSSLLVEGCANSGALSVDTSNNREKPMADQSYYIGGITGRNTENGKITASFNNGTITSLSKYTGGIVEVNEGQIEGCVNNSKIISTKGYVGGIVGLNGEKTATALVSGCFATPNVEIMAKGDCVGSIAGENRAKMENCFAQGVQVKSTGKYVGGIVGQNTGTNASMTGSYVVSPSLKEPPAYIMGGSYVGGIVGRNDAKITMNGLSNSATVRGENFVGGIVGDTSENGISTMENCTNSGIVAAVPSGYAGSLTSNAQIPPSGSRIDVGGITGTNPKGSLLINCVNSGTVIGRGIYTGGIVSYNAGTLENCTATNKSVVRGAQSAGGIVGLNESTGTLTLTGTGKTLNSKVSSSYNKAGSAYVGGLMAANESMVTRTFDGYSFKGSLSFENRLSNVPTLAETSDIGQYAGGIMGKNRNGDTLSNCSFTGKISGGNGGSGGIVGINYGKVENIQVGATGMAGSVSGYVRAGGISGVSMPGSITTNVKNGNSLTVQAGYAAGGIHGLYYAGNSGASFQQMQNDATVKALGAAGGLIGELKSEGDSIISFHNCTNGQSGVVTGGVVLDGFSMDEHRYRGIGGLVGLAESATGLAEGKGVTINFERCNNAGTVDGIEKVRGVGGIIGMGTNIKTLSLTNCVNENTVAGRSAGVGGIVGASQDSGLTVTNCKNSKEVVGTAPMLEDSSFFLGTGGIVGVIADYSGGEQEKSVEISNCVNEASVTGGGLGTGGVIGTIMAQNKNSVTVKNCTNGKAGSALVLTGSNHTGGIVGRGVVKNVSSTVTIEDCMNYMKVTTPGNEINVGGILGSWEGTSLQVSKGENHGAITIAGKAAGGIAGSIVNAGGEKSEVIDCINNAAVNAGGAIANSTAQDQTNAASAGGIVGTSKSSGGGSVEITNCNNNSSISSVNGSSLGFQVGGILGSAKGGVVNLTNCTNENAVHATIEKARGSVGGIAGYYMSDGKISDCINDMPFQLPESMNSAAITDGGAVVGGIVGYWHSGTIDSCTNNGAITSKEGGVGGIAGVNLGLSSTMRNCINNAAITIIDGSNDGRIGTGGLLGYFHNNSTGPLEISGSTNTGVIKIQSRGNSNSTGGVIGLLSTSVQEKPITLNSLVNTGEITVNGAGKVGGIIGWMRRFGNPIITLENSANFGTINHTNSGGETGGIVGKAEYSLVQSCYNFGEIDSAVAAGGVGTGGIAGTIYEGKAKVVDCINVGAITNSAAKIVGGIVGVNQGEVVSCQNLAYGDLPNKPKAMTDLIAQAAAHSGSSPSIMGLPFVTGSAYVGGIAGICSIGKESETGLIYSDTTKTGYNITRNSMPISASSYVGGIAGELKGGSVTVAFNSGTVTASGDYAGGIAGTVGSNGVQGDGGISGAFNLGAVAGTKAGGLVGERKSASKNSFPIKDGFFIADQVAETTLNGFTGRWRIGNEPYGTVGDVGGELDQPKIKDSNGNDLVVSEMKSMEFLTMYPDITLEMINSGDMQALISAVETALKNYVVKLGAPRIISIGTDDVTKGNGYTTMWGATTGATSGYELQYKIIEKKDDVSADGVTLNGGAFPTELDRKDTKNNNFFNPENIGRYFTVQAKAIGKLLGGEMKTVDSDWSAWYTPPQLIIPPMLAPEISVSTKVGTARSFSISNYADYALVGKPEGNHPNLNKITDPAYEAAYEKYENGLVGFVMTVEGDSSIYPLIKNDNGTYSHDYEFILGQGVPKKNFKVTIKAVPKNSPSAYYISSTTIDVMVVKTIKLAVSAPQLTYHGISTAAADADYQFAVQGHEKALHYDFWLTKEDGTEIYRGSLPKGTSPKVNLSTLSEFKISDYFGQTITAHVKAIGDGEFYLDSDEATVTTKVVQKLLPPEIKVERQKNADGSFTDQYKLSWTGGDNFGYRGTVIQTEAAIPATQPKEFPISNFTAQEMIVDYSYNYTNTDTEIINGFQLNASIQQLGVIGKSLDSDPGSLLSPYLVRPRLMIDRTTAPLAAQNQIGEPLKYTFQWTELVKDKGLTADNCAGYKLFVTNYKTNDMASGESVTSVYTVSDVNTTTYEHVFSEEYAGKPVSFYIYAVGVDGKNSDSLKSNTVNFNLPQKLLPPLNVTAIGLTNESKPLASYGELEYGLSWVVNGGNNPSFYSGFKLEVLHEETVLHPFIPTDKESTVQRFRLNELGVADVSTLAGETLTFRVRTESLLQISSDWVTIEVTLPKILLDAPSNVRYNESTATVPGEMGTVEWDAVLNATQYRVEYKQKDSLPEEPFATMEVTGNSFRAIKNMGLVQIVALGDGKKYADSNPSDRKEFALGLQPKPFPTDAAVEVGYTEDAIQWKHVGDYVGKYSLKLTMAAPPVATFVAEPEAASLEWNPFSSLMIVAGETAVETAEVPLEEGVETPEEKLYEVGVDLKELVDLEDKIKDDPLSIPFNLIQEGFDKTLLRAIIVVAHAKEDDDVVLASETIPYDSTTTSSLNGALDGIVDEAIPPEMMLPVTPIVPEGTTPEDSEPTTPDDGEPTTPDGGEPTTPDGGEPTTPDGGELTAPDGGEPTAPDGGEPTAPDGGEPTAPDGGELIVPDGSDPITSEGSDSPSTPEETESSDGGSVSVMSMTLCAGAVTSLAGMKRKSKNKTK